jgi:hypothetical protein
MACDLLATCVASGNMASCVPIIPGGGPP